MVISFEASASEDSSLFGYFSLKYDPDFFQDIRENLLEISKNDLVSFTVNPDDMKLIYAEFYTVRRIIKIADIEQNKFTDVFKINFDHKTAKRFQTVKLNIDKEYFYFTGVYHKHKSKLPIEFQSLNFDIRFIDSLQRTYEKQESMVG